MRGELDPNVNFFALFPVRSAIRPRASPGRRRRLDLPRRQPVPRAVPAVARLLGRVLAGVHAAAPGEPQRGHARPPRPARRDCWPAVTRSSARSTGSPPVTPTRRTGSRLFNASLDYYDSWVGRDADRQSGPPTLTQALRAERDHYLSTVRPKASSRRRGPGSTRTGASISRSTASTSSTHRRSARPVPTTVGSRSRVCASTPDAGQLAAGRGPERRAPRRRRRPGHVDGTLGRHAPASKRHGSLGEADVHAHRHRRRVRSAGWTPSA